MSNQINIGDVVRTGVYVCNEWKGMWQGTVISLSSDGTLAGVDIGSMHGCREILRTEQVSHLRKESPAPKEYATTEGLAPFTKRIEG